LKERLRKREEKETGRVEDKNLLELKKNAWRRMPK